MGDGAGGAGTWKAGIPCARVMRSVRRPAAVDLTFHPSLSAVNGCAVDDGDDHLRLKRAVELTQYPTQGDVEALTSLAVGLLDRGRLAG